MLNTPHPHSQLSTEQQQQQNNGRCNKFITRAHGLDWEVPGKTAAPAPVKC